MGVDGGDAAAKTSLVAITEIEANDLGIGITGVVGLAAGANAVAASTIFNTIDMSDADISETFFGTENTADNTDVLLAAIFKRQPDGTRGLDSDGLEVPGTRYFYGCAYSAVDLTLLGKSVVRLLGHMAIQATTAALSFEISGDIGDLETKIFGNQASEFNNGNPLVEYLTGRNSSGTRLPVGKSIYDLLGAYLDAGGGAGTDNIAADLALILAAVKDSSESAGPFSYLDSGSTQTVVEDTSLTTRRKVYIEIDLQTMTQNGTVILNRKVDGSTFRQFDSVTFLAASANKVLTYEFTTNQHWQLTYLESSDEGAARSVPFNVITEPLE